MQGSLRHLVHTAALVLVIILDILTFIVVCPGTNAIHGLGTLLRGTLLILVRVRASITIVLPSSRDCVDPATLVVVCLLVMSAITVLVPGSFTIHRLRACLISALLVVRIVRALVAVVQGHLAHAVSSAALVRVVSITVEAKTVVVPSTNAVNRLGTHLSRALHIRVSKWASITVVGRSSGDLEHATLLVLVIFMVLTATVVSEFSQAVHRLGTALRRALLEGMCVRAAVTIVGNIGRDLVDPAAPVLVVVGVMEAAIILSPSASTIHRLVALLLCALHLAVLVRALVAIKVSLGGDLVGAAALVLVAINHMVTAGVRTPLALTIHRLAAARLRALLQCILMRASVAIILGFLGNLVHTAALILVVSLVIHAGIVGTPGANTINGLVALLRGTLFGIMLVRASITTVLGRNSDLVQPAALALMFNIVILALGVVLPTSSAVDRLGTSLRGTLDVRVRVLTIVAIVS